MTRLRKIRNVKEKLLRGKKYGIEKFQKKLKNQSANNHTSRPIGRNFIQIII